MNNNDTDSDSEKNTENDKKSKVDSDYGLSEIEKNLNKSTMYVNNMKIANSYNFEDFDIVKELEECRNFSMTITSKRRTGKSVLMTDLCSKIKGWYEAVYVFSLTAEYQKDLFAFVPKENVYVGFNEQKLEELWSLQEKIVAKEILLKTDPKKIPKILILFDDLISIPKVKKSEILNRLFVAGRHLHFAQIFITQTFTGIPPILRTNVDVAVAFYLESADNRESFSKQYLSTKNTRLGMMIFDRITKEDYQCIVIVACNGNMKEPESYIRKYTAKLKVRKFLMGNDLTAVSKKGLQLKTYTTKETITMLPKMNKNLYLE